MDKTVESRIESTNVLPHWLPSGNAFWYKRSFEPDKYQFFFVNILLKTLYWINWDGKSVFYRTIRHGETKQQVTYVGHVWRLADTSNERFRAFYAVPNEDSHVAIIEHLSGSIPEASPPSDSKESDEELTGPEAGALYVKNFNLWYKDDNAQVAQLSKNGTKENSFDDNHIYKSRDSQYVVAWQYTPEQDHNINLVESSPKDQVEPKLHTKRYLKPGDRTRTDRTRLFDLKNHNEVSTDDTLFRNPYRLNSLGWNKNSQEYFFYYDERGHQHVREVGVSVNGHVRALSEEQSTTFVDYTKVYYKVLHNSDELLWSSERDGHNHLYLIDLVTGTVKTQITKGSWMVNLVEAFDEERRQIWLRGYGLNDGEDPYHAHLVRVNFDGSDFKILTNGDGTHSWAFSPNKRYFKDTWSRVDSDLQHTKKYPVLDSIYSGPHGFSVPKAFSALSRQQQWADEGYIVVQIEGMGTNWRGKHFHDVCYKNLHDAGLPDHVAWLKTAASTRLWLDLSRVGIMGGSAGGQNAVAGMLHHSEFFKAGIADSDCRDNRMDKLWWNEL
ncbi:hypothetical protein FGRMN_3112 [Fusarium graminum]|nr:hypothetical protein FGRMN_3112 [Fusarium graminum]